MRLAGELDAGIAARFEPLAREYRREGGAKRVR